MSSGLNDWCMKFWTMLAMTPKLTLENLNDVVSSCLYFIEVKASSKAITIPWNSRPIFPSSNLTGSKSSRCC